MPVFAPWLVWLVRLVVAVAGPASSPPTAAPGSDPALPPASDPETAAGPAADPETRSESDAASQALPEQVRDIYVPAAADQPEHPERASSVVSQREIEERLPRSTPDALRYEPGVYVQQSAHAQASPYVRGLTGQQTVMAFDGIRLNNSTFRQGPNQYFFLIDSRTVMRLEVLRGAASTRYGSDAIGGALLATPIDPTMDRSRDWSVHPKAMMSTRTADRELGGRAQIDLGYRGRIGLFGGFGYRDVDALRTSGPIIEPATGEPYKSPRFEDDQRTQRGTGFREYTSDARLVYQPSHDLKFTVAYYDYRQKDAPRTDRCPADGAPEDSCLIYLDQFRTLVYGALDLRDGPAAAERMRLTASYQNQHEHRFLFSDNGLPEVDGGVENHGADDVHTYGSGLWLATKDFELGRLTELGVEYGVDAYLDTIESQAWQRITDYDPPEIRIASRGQYIDDSAYLTSGVYAQPHLALGRRLELRTGGRFAYAQASSPGDATSRSLAIDEFWLSGVGNVGGVVSATEWLDFHLGADQGFRAPNLDDLTSRQQTGPGFQYENADLDPERALTLEAGAKVDHRLIELSAFGYRTRIRDMIARAPRTAEDCPSQDDGCDESRTRFQLVNLEGPADIWGADAELHAFLPHGFGLRTTISYTWGEGPDPVAEPDLGQSDAPRVPLSRIPPLNGTAELGWRGGSGFWGAAALRWATRQDRLAQSDIADIRIPRGGTPGFAVVDLRAGYRWDPYMLLALNLENIADVAHRYHGSSVNGPARSLIVTLAFGM